MVLNFNRLIYSGLVGSVLALIEADSREIGAEAEGAQA